MRWCTCDGLTDYGVNFPEQFHRRRWLSLIRHFWGVPSALCLSELSRGILRVVTKSRLMLPSTPRSPLYKVDIALHWTVPLITKFLVIKLTLVI